MSGHHQGVHLVTAQRREILAQQTISQEFKRLPGPALLWIEKRLDHHEGDLESRP